MKQTDLMNDELKALAGSPEAVVEVVSGLRTYRAALEWLLSRAGNGQTLDDLLYVQAHINGLEDGWRPSALTPGTAPHYEGSCNGVGYHLIETGETYGGSAIHRCSVCWSYAAMADDVEHNPECERPREGYIDWLRDPLPYDGREVDDL